VDDIWLIVLLIVATVVLVLVFLFKIIPLTKLKERAYRKIFFGDSTLKDFPDEPKIAINSTNLESGRLMTFSKNKISDSYYRYDKEIKFKSENFPVSYAVACSTAVPYPFHPLNIPKSYYANEEDFGKVKPALVDGGIYDNQGIHKITQTSSSYKCDIVICSDGSSPFTRKFYNINPLPVLGRVMNVMMARIKNFQFIQHVYDTNEVAVSEIAYFSINWKYERCISGFCNNLKNGRIRSDVVNQHQIPDHISESTGVDLINYIKDRIQYTEIIQKGLTEEQIDSISNIGTSLHSLDPEQINLLSTHADVLSEIQLRLYCPSLFS
jgi:NTE family protein